MMRTQKYKIEYATVLLNIAEGDFSTLEILYNSMGGRKENICFMAQQVVEKCLRALLVKHRIGVPSSHSLELLISLLPESFIPPKAEVLDGLTEYATVRRYEEGYADLSDEDLKSAFDVTKMVLDFAKKKIL